MKSVNVNRVAPPLDVVSVDLYAQTRQFYSRCGGPVAGGFPLGVKQHHFAASLYWDCFAYSEEAMNRVGSVDMKLDRTLKGLIARLRHWERRRDRERSDSDLRNRSRAYQSRNTEHNKTHV